MIDTIRNLSSIQGYPFSRLPKFTFAEKLMIKGAYDFIGLNHYTSTVTADDSSEVKDANFFNDALVRQYKDPAWPTSAASWLVVSNKKYYKTGT